MVSSGRVYGDCSRCCCCDIGMIGLGGGSLEAFGFNNFSSGSINARFASCSNDGVLDRSVSIICGKNSA